MDISSTISALKVFLKRYALYILTFYLLTYLLTYIVISICTTNCSIVRCGVTYLVRYAMLAFAVKHKISDRPYPSINGISEEWDVVKYAKIVGF